MKTETNTVKLAGNVSNDPKFIFDNTNNFKVLNFTIVTTRQYLRNGSFANEKSFHKVSLRGECAEQYKDTIKKSMGIEITGYLRNRNIIKENVRCVVTEVAVDESTGTVNIL